MGLCNILAAKLAYPEEMTLCYKFRPSDGPSSGLLNSSKKKRHLICYRREQTKAGYYLNKQLFPQWKNFPVNLEREKIESHYFL